MNTTPTDENRNARMAWSRWQIAAIVAVAALLLIALILPAFQPARESGPVVTGSKVARWIATATTEPLAIEHLLRARPRLVESASAPSESLSSDIALAGIITCDGYVEPAWQLASRSGAGLVALARAMGHLPDAALRIELYHYLAPLAASEDPPQDVTCAAEKWDEVRSASLRAIAQVPAREDEVRSLIESLASVNQLSEASAAAMKLLDEPRDLHVRRLVRSYKPGDAAAVLKSDARPSLALGRRLFHELSCHKCHRVEGSSGPLGPSLADTKLSTSPEKIFIAIVDPDAQVASDYQEYMVIADGKVTTGLVIDEDESRIVLSTDPLHDCEPVVIEREDIEEPPRPLTTSPMSSGMVDSLTESELRSLVHFVARRGQMNE
jgi:putative heme-binding domain-containing protein